MPYANHRDLISDANVRRMLFNAATMPAPMSWLDRIATPIIQHHQPVATYVDVGSAPAVQEFTGKRETQDQRFDEFSITSKIYNVGTRVRKIDLVVDKLGFVDLQMQALATRWQNHWQDLGIAALKAGETTACFDGQFYYDTDHRSGKSATQSNIITPDVAVPTNPTPEEAEIALWSAVEKFGTFVDDNNQPIDAAPSSFLIVAPIQFARSLAAATKMAYLPDAAGGMNALVTVSGKTFELATPTQIGITGTHGAAWTDKFAVFTTDSRALIRQTLAGWETDTKVKGPGTDYEYDTFSHEYGISGYRAVGYGDWKCSVLVQFTSGE